MSLNQVQLIGNLGQDPECRRTQSGALVVNLSVATSEVWRDKQSGEKQERTEWHRVTIFNEHAAKFAEQYLKKGQRVFVQGQLQTRKWTDQSNIERYTTEVVLTAFRGELQSLEKPPSNRPPPAQDQSEYGRTTTRDSSYGRSYDDDDAGSGAGQQQLNDEIPF